MLRLALILSFLAVPGIVDAQAPLRVRGAITASDGKMISVRDPAGKTVEIQLVDKTEIVATQAITLADIKPGDFLGVTSSKRADGSLSALEVRRFPKPLNPGHRPFDGRDDQTMTNATVSATVASTSGRELTMSYEGGQQKIVVPQNAAISMLVPGERAQLVPGALVNLTAAPGADGKLAAVRIQVSKAP
jgi:hypothetical protein